ncbi:MAG: hypothetical protein AAF789_08345, partial [Bacteroidota bacterium]
MSDKILMAPEHLHLLLDEELYMLEDSTQRVAESQAKNGADDEAITTQTIEILEDAESTQKISTNKRSEEKIDTMVSVAIF